MIELINLDFQKSILVSYHELLKSQPDTVKENISTIDSELQVLNKSSLSKDDYKFYIERYNHIESKRELAVAKLDPLRDKLEDGSRKILEIQRDTKIAQLNSEEKAFFERFILVGIVISIALILSGFCLWYIKLQAYQDLILKKQANTVDISNGQPISREVVNNP